MMWNENLKVGIPLIDSQHRELCNRIDSLFDACGKGQGKEEIVKTVEFLEQYTIFHFGQEEELQRKSSYPKIAEHKAMHEYFKSEIAKLKTDIQEHGVSVATISKTNYFLMNWLLNHIQKVDSELKNYIQP